MFIVSQSVFAQNAEKFEVEGITVIMKPTVKDIINVNIYYKGGVTNYPAEKAERVLQGPVSGDRMWYWFLFAGCI